MPVHHLATAGETLAVSINIHQTVTILTVPALADHEARAAKSAYFGFEFDLLGAHRAFLGCFVHVLLLGYRVT
jgi:hypothetical protein